MKNFKFLTISVLLVVAVNLHAQIKISDISSSAPDGNAILELESSDKGLIPPKVRINNLTQATPLTAPVDSGTLVYSVGGTVIDGYYLWDGGKWRPIATGLGSVNVAAKTSNATLTKAETFVVASNDITLTLPAVTSADNGLTITVKNIGDHTDQIAIVGNSGALIDNSDTIKLYRWRARTFVAYEGNWLRKEKDKALDDVYEVSSTGSWTTIPEVLEFLAEHMLGPAVVSLDAGTYEIPATQVVELPYSLTIQGPSYGQAYVVPATGISQGSALFSCVSEVSFKMIAFDATAKSGYGTHDGENALDLITAETYHEIKDCTFDRFNKAIYITNNVDVWLFETDIDSAIVAGVEIDAGTAKYVSFYTSESYFSNCGYAINLASGDSAIVSVQNCTFDCGVDGNVALNYVPGAGNFTNIYSLFFTNNTWDRIGTFIDGFDFTRSDGRDANVEILNNAGIEDKNPKIQLSVVDNANTTSLSSPNTQWYTPSWAVDDTVIVNWSVNGNQITYLPSNSRDVFIIVSGNVNSSTTGSITIAIAKTNGQGTTYHGATTFRFFTQSAGNDAAFSTLVYLQNVDEGDQFSVVFQHTATSGTIRFQDVNIFANAQ
jgi:hypothetical protein